MCVLPSSPPRICEVTQTATGRTDTHTHTHTKRKKTAVLRFCHRANATIEKGDFSIKSKGTIMIETSHKKQNHCWAKKAIQSGWFEAGMRKRRKRDVIVSDFRIPLVTITPRITIVRDGDNRSGSGVYFL
uniref:Uncharacterized protein n=1 Tax=Trypanosoma vivax (strain Y486) TaxID=1055687 RepID=G0TTE4_TRYVY|nr:hypothetical protein, unlikely [Trypanosoma vivax Y486]